MSIHKQLCPSGPTVWDWRIVFELGPNVGYQIKNVSAMRRAESETRYAELQAEAWQMARQALDNGQPCYAWELMIPEFYVIYGYDETGYYYSGAGCDDGAGPKPWQELGKDAIGLLEVSTVSACPPAAPEKTIKDALSFALTHAQVGNSWAPDYSIGLSGYDAWAAALEEGQADRFGLGYNTEVWAICRGAAVNFLQETKQKLPGKADALFDEAIAHLFYRPRQTESAGEYLSLPVTRPAASMDQRSPSRPNRPRRQSRRRECTRGSKTNSRRTLATGRGVPRPVQPPEGKATAFPLRLPSQF